MLLQVTLQILLLSLILTNVHSKQYQPNFCAECEDEVWEEVPCDAIYSSSSTVSSTPYTSPTYLPTSTPMPSTSPSTLSTSTENSTAPSTPSTPPTPITFAPRTSSSTSATLAPPVYATIHDKSKNAIESSEGYKKCYCECKSGCREFCRKVVLYPDTNKQMLQLSKTNEPQVNGYVEIKHTHERNFVQSPPTYKPNVVQPNPHYQTLQPRKPCQQQPPNPSGSSQYTYNGVSYEGIPNVLSSGYGYSNIVPGINQINYPLPNQPLMPNYPSYDRPPYKPENAAQSSYSEQSYYNAIPKNSQLPVYPTPPPYQTPDNTVHAQTAISGNGNAAAIAISPNAYKSSCSSNPSQGYVGSPRAPNSPCAVRYIDTSSALNSLQNLEPSIDNYLREFLYGNPPKGQGYRRPL